MHTREALEHITAELLSTTQTSPGSDISEDDHRLAAWWFLQAELLGLPAFGVAMAGREIRRLANAEAPSDIPEPRGLIDARTIPGHVALAAAVRRITNSGMSTGVHAIALRNVGALGILGSAARELALRGMVSLVIANSPPIVAPWGGTAPAIGTNPIAAATPRRQGAVVVDFSTASITVAELKQARESSSDLREPGALDTHGRPTLNALSAHALLPASLEGSLSGFIVELLTGVAIGRDWEHGRSALVVAIDPEYFGTDINSTSEEFTQTWLQAGGHLPSRFSALPHSAEQAPATFDLSPEDFWKKLRSS